MDKKLEAVIAFIIDYKNFYKEETNIYMVLDNLLRHIKRIVKNDNIEKML